MGMISAYCGFSWNDLYRLWILIGMASTIMVTHGNGLYYNGYLLEWPLLLLKHIGMVSTIVAPYGNDLYYC